MANDITPATPEQKRRLKQALAEQMSKFFESDVWGMDMVNLGNIGDEAHELMADAALAVLLSQNDVQLYLQKDGQLNHD